MQLLMAEEEARKEESMEKRRSTLLHPSSSAEFDYSPYHDNTFTFPYELQEREVSVRER